MERQEESKALGKVASGSMAWVLALMAALWVLLVGGLHRDEVIVGSFSVLGAGAMFWLVARVRGMQMRFTARDLATGWRLPWYTVKDLWTVTRVLALDVFAGERAPSAFRVCGFRTSKRRPEDVARRVLVTAYTSATPNAIVLGIDPDQSRLLLHQLERSEISETMRELGARG